MSSAAADGSRRLQLKLPATPAGFSRGFDELRHGLDGLPLDPRARFGVELVFEEVVANVLRHGSRPNGETRIQLEVALEHDAVRLVFEDDGPPFDPRERPDPAPPTDLEHAPTGGRGLMLIRRFSSGLEYLRTPEGRNRLTVTVPRVQRDGKR